MKCLSVFSTGSFALHRRLIVAVLCAVLLGSGWVAADTGPAVIRLRTVTLGQSVGPAESWLPMPEDGRLFLLQAAIPWRDDMRAAVWRSGCDFLGAVPERTYLLRCGPMAITRIRSLAFAGRIEPYHCSYRLAPEVGDWLAMSGADEEETRRFRFVTPGPEEIAALADRAEALGATVLGVPHAGSVIEVVTNRTQLRELSCADETLFVDGWRAPQAFMGDIRELTGANWLEQPANGGYCGTGVRGEVLDEGMDQDHVEYASRLTLHGTVRPNVSHGTSTFGEIFSAGTTEPLSRGLLPCGDGVGGDNQDIVAGTTNYVDFTSESKNTYHVSFQSNSWGNAVATAYDSFAYERDEAVWRLDLAITQASGNSGKDPVPNLASEGLSKNSIVVGGVHHQNNADPSDDFWCDHDCGALHPGDQFGCTADAACTWFVFCRNSWTFCGSNGPTIDGRIKPDVSSGNHLIFTTDTNTQGDDIYTNSFLGTSASAPHVAGVIGLILEAWADTGSGTNAWGRVPAGTTVFDKQPHASTIKALLVNGARPYPFSAPGEDLERMNQGWGTPSARQPVEWAASSFLDDEETSLVEGDKLSQRITVTAGQPRLRATLTWNEPPKLLSAAGQQVLNDLDLKLVSPPDGGGNVSVYCGNHGLTNGNISVASWTGPGSQSAAPDCDDPALAGTRDSLNNLENIWLEESSPGAGIAEGTWLVEVKAVSIAVDANPLAACRDINLDPNDPEANRAACESAGCQWDGTRGLCGDTTFDSVFGLVLTGGTAQAAASLPGDSAGLTVAKNGAGSLDLAWNPDCGAGTQYGVYRGDLASGYSSIAPEPGQCAVATESVTIPEGAGKTDFFLVVPAGGSEEGSYGKDSSGAERPAATSPCQPAQNIDACG